MSMISQQAHGLPAAQARDSLGAGLAQRFPEECPGECPAACPAVAAIGPCCELVPPRDVPMLDGTAPDGAAPDSAPEPCAAMTAVCLAAAPAAVPAARHRVRDALQGWRVSPATREAAMLIASELVTNAVQFGQRPGAGPSHVCLALWRRSRSVLIEVSDSSPAQPVPRDAAPDAERGRGLQIVAALSEGWGVRRASSGGKVTWATVTADPDRQPERAP